MAELWGKNFRREVGFFAPLCLSDWQHGLHLLNPELLSSTRQQDKVYLPSGCQANCSFGSLHTAAAMLSACEAAAQWPSTANTTLDILTLLLLFLSLFIP